MKTRDDDIKRFRTAATDLLVELLRDGSMTEQRAHAIDILFDGWDQAVLGLVLDETVQRSAEKLSDYHRAAAIEMPRMCAEKCAERRYEIERTARAAAPSPAKRTTAWLAAAEAMPRIVTPRSAEPVPRKQAWSVRTIVAAVRAAIGDLVVRWMRVL